MLCRFCNRERNWPCVNTRDMKDTSDKICYSSLLEVGGGEYTVDREASIQWHRNKRKS